MKLPLLFKVYRRSLALTSYVLPSYVGVLNAKRFMTPTRHQRPEWEKRLSPEVRKKHLMLRSKPGTGDLLS